MVNLILTISISFLITLLLTPLMILIAKRKNIYDVPNQRKEHQTLTPLLGGVAICIAVSITVLFFAKSTNSYVLPLMVLGSITVAFMGLIDDIIQLSEKRRMILLFIIAIIVFYGSLQFYINEYGILRGNLLETVIFSILSIIWIVGVTNAINFSDGLDGLASYLSIVSVISFAIIFALQGRDMLVLYVALALLGAIAGFIPYNRNPALIFMGDSGSMYIGFLLSLLAIASIAHETTLLSIVVPIFILFVPILDLCMAILRRLVLKKSIFKPDKMHFHHILNRRINNQIVVVIILSLIQILFAAIGVIILINKTFILGWIIIGITILISSVQTIVFAFRKRTVNHS